jgi:hypothetical protein
MQITLTYQSGNKTTTYEGELFGDYYADMKAVGVSLDKQERAWGKRIGCLVTHKDKCYLHLTKVRATHCTLTDEDGNPEETPPVADTVFPAKDFDVTKIVLLQPRE